MARLRDIYRKSILPQLKKEFDPMNLFRLNSNIAPA